MPELRSQHIGVYSENKPNVAAVDGAGQALEIQCDPNDEKILNATIKAFESGSLTPLIKEELRCTIQSRRLAQGKGELKVEFKSPPKKREMTEEERSRYLKRRVQNREAAQRFRQKQKDTSDLLTAKIKRLERNSKVLLADLTKLREEKDSLREMLASHLLVCTNQHRIPTLVSQHELDQLLADQIQDESTLGSACGSSVSTYDSLSPTGSVSTRYQSPTPPPRPGTADSSAAGSDVFFFSEEDNEGVNLFDANLDTEVEVIVTSGGSGAHDLALETLNHNINLAEEVVVETPVYTSAGESVRLNSASNVDTLADTRGLNSSVGSLSCLNSSVLYGGHSLPSGPPVVCPQSFNPDLSQGIVLYTDQTGQKLQGSTHVEPDESLISVLSQSHNSGVALSTTGEFDGDVVVADDEAPGGLAESTSDLRHSLAFAYARVHDMCDLDLSDAAVQDLLLQSDAVP